jgi:hypothetical protein
MAAAPSEMDEELAGVTVPSFLKAGFKGRDLVDIDRKRAFVLVDHDIALAAGHGDRGDFPGEAAVVAGLLGAGGRAMANSSCASRVKP